MLVDSQEVVLHMHLRKGTKAFGDYCQCIFLVYRPEIVQLFLFPDD